MLPSFNFIMDEDNSLHVLDYLDSIEMVTRRPKILQKARNLYEDYDEVAFKTRFRLSKSSAIQVLEMIENKLEWSSNRNNPLSPMNQLLLTLRFYATGCHQLTMGDFCVVSRSIANRVIHRVTAAIASLSKTYIKFPQNESDIRRTQKEFYNIAKFPKVIGALDCTHIKIQSPGGEHAETFRNRKGYMSINVQAICNANLLITDIVARWPGSAHDERIFSSFRRNAMFEMGNYGDSVLVAESGYMNRDYIMMPLDRVSSHEEALYNESQIRTRNCIESLFVIWKKRFPVLAVGIRVQLNNCLPIIVATAVLHNLLQINREEVPIDDPDLELPAPWANLIDRGRIRQQDNIHNRRDINPIRRALINNYFQSL